MGEAIRAHRLFIRAPTSEHLGWFLLICALHFFLLNAADGAYGARSTNSAYLWKLLYVVMARLFVTGWLLASWVCLFRQCETGSRIRKPGFIFIERRKITRQSKSNLALAFVAFGRERHRDYITTFYAFCRLIDDIADDPQLVPEEKARQLSQWRASCDRLSLTSRALATELARSRGDAVGRAGNIRKTIARCGNRY